MDILDHARLRLLNNVCSAHISIPLRLAGLPGEYLVCAMRASSHLLLEEMSSFVFSSALGDVEGQGTFCFIDGVPLQASHLVLTATLVRAVL